MSASSRPPARPRRATKGPVDPARLAAFDVLRAVRVDDAYANLALPHALAAHGLSGRDAAFATELVSGTLRLRGRYDAILRSCMDRNPDAKVLDALRLGAHQLLSMRVPDHAAISTTVDLVRAKANTGAAGFANAVLRRVAAKPLAAWLDGLSLADRTSHPTWVVDELREALLERGDEIEPLLEADNVAPRVVLVARPGLIDRADLPGEPTSFSPFGVELAAGSPGELRAVRDGRAGVQDEGSQLVALALAGAPVDGRDPSTGSGRRELWLDLCAGPGGKAALLAALAAQRGAAIIANEAQPHRAELVRKALAPALSHGARAGVAGVVAGDGTRPPFRPGTFDRVLVDAPCTGLGALRRRPEARWRRRPEDVAPLVDLQVRLLTSALDLTRAGGVVLYSTCSPVLAETIGVVETVLRQRPEVTLEPLPLDVPDSDGPLPGTRQLWPHRHGTDAMFMALLRR